mmetsp:Transcript_25964/g.71240  ORF Transcript_25964/g.71240 Transcript_25964/m.71240 type:complete len:83 (-) Transcript_25964:2650-2898(-)
MRKRIKTLLKLSNQTHTNHASFHGNEPLHNNNQTNKQKNNQTSSQNTEAKLLSESLVRGKTWRVFTTPFGGDSFSVHSTALI